MVDIHPAVHHRVRNGLARALAAEPARRRVGVALQTQRERKPSSRTAHKHGPTRRRLKVFSPRKTRNIVS